MKFLIPINLINNLQLTLLLLLPLSLLACPGSPVKVHAKCDMHVEFSNSCNEVVSEITNRITGTNTARWIDPHNNGNYTITNSSSISLQGFRTTANGKYTDKFDFLFTTSNIDNNNGCIVETCSESQVRSILDFFY